MKKGTAVSVYFDDKALKILDDEVAKRADADRAAGLTGHSVTNRSKLISHIVTEFLIDRETGQLTITQIKELVTPILRRHGVARAVLFGSYARGEQTDQSDVDIAIDEGEVRGLAFFKLQNELTEALHKQVDLQSLNGGNSKFLNNVRKDAIELYAA